MLLTGQSVSPSEALKLGLVEAMVPSDQLIARARDIALASAHAAAPWDRRNARFDPGPYDFSSSTAFAEIAESIGLSDYQMRHYPAYRAIMHCVVGGWNLPMTEASEHEMRVFVALMQDPVAGNMVRTLFLKRQKAAKLGLLGANSPFANEASALLPRVKLAREQALAAQLTEEELLVTLAFVAIEVWGEGRIEHPSFADVAIVAAGLFPAYTGGPFTYVEQCGPKVLAEHAASARGAALFTVPLALNDYFASRSLVSVSS
jgi:3-hydroxyacyl-CoA dehydrogenase/enoyl-CoA hydratase/3-hydroxybutyryl-CoA epimerase